MLPKNTKILVVDDMRTMRMIVQKALDKMGFVNVTEARDGSVAIPLIDDAVNAGDPFKLIFCDWNMPEVAGIDVLKHVRANGKMSDTAFIMVTAEREQHQIMEAIKHGVTDYIAKPFTQDTISQKINARFGKKAS
jgi:two-component system, chemotaxis family, chemotaxis protein CheY